MLTDTQIKPAFHQLIDEIENKQYLRELYESIAGLLPIKGDILEGLTPFEAKKTQNSILEVESGQTTPDDVVRQKIAQKWHIK
ncbi:MAG: hypothetical protein U5M51_14525 [Emticicia sp.]|nr:hypothetical protein [Emticicia sp.]